MHNKGEQIYYTVNYSFLPSKRVKGSVKNKKYPAKQKNVLPRDRIQEPTSSRKIETNKLKISSILLDFSSYLEWELSQIIVLPCNSSAEVKSLEFFSKYWLKTLKWFTVKNEGWTNIYIQSESLKP